MANYSRYRADLLRQLEDNPQLSAGDVTSINLTMISGGVQGNMVPTAMKISFDIRLSLKENHVEYDKMVRA